MNPPHDSSEQPASAPPPFRYARQIFLAISGAAFIAIVVAARGVLLPFMLAALVAYVLFPAVRAVERKWLPRWLAILLVYSVAIGSAAAFGSAVIPRLFDETKKLSAELPKLTQRIRDDWLPALDARLQRMTGAAAKPAASASATSAPAAPPPPPVRIVPLDDGSYEVHVSERLQFSQQQDGSFIVGPPPDEPRGFSSQRAFRDAFDKAVSYAQKNSLELLELGRAIVGGVSRGIFYFFITLMLAGYMMYTYERILAFMREMWAIHRRAAFDRFLKRVDRGLSGVVRGQLLICLVNGVLSAIGFWIFDLKYWPILSVIAALMSIIPIFGSILSSIPAVAIGLTQGFGTALGVLIWIIGIHQLEANFLNPKIIGDQAKIHPVLVVFALLLGEHYFQITGALLAVPCLALAQALFMHFRESILGIPSRISMVPEPATAAASTSDPGSRTTLVVDAPPPPVSSAAPSTEPAEMPAATPETEPLALRRRPPNATEPADATDPQPTTEPADATEPTDTTEPAGDGRERSEHRSTLKSHT